MSRSRWFGLIALVSLLLCAGLGLGVRWYTNSTSQAAGESAPADVSPPPEPTTLTLPSAEREYLWDIEHHGNLLSQQGFRAVADALRKEDAAALTALLSADFTGQVPQQPRQVRLDTDFAQVLRQEDSGEPPLQLDRPKFVARLLDYRRLFARPPQVKLALMGLAPTVRGKLDSIWQGTCQLRMWGEAAAGRPAEVVLYLQYRLPCPTEETLKKKGWLRSCTILQSQEAKASRLLLREVTAERGINPKRFHDNWTDCTEKQPLTPITGGVYLCDYDRDGILDVLLTDITGFALYKGKAGGKFEDVTARVGLPASIPQQSASEILAVFADLDGDGWEDLIVGNQLFRNDKGQQFTDVSGLTNLRLLADASGIVVADYDRDGRVDLYLTRSGKGKSDSWIEGRNGDSHGNYLYRNMGNWLFKDVTAESNAGGDRRSTFSALWFDADNDGWPDLYVLNEFGNGVLLHNEGNGRFREHSLMQGAGDFGSMGVTAGDINNDGRIDLYIANMYSKAGNRVIGNLRPDTYKPEILARLRSLVAGSQLYLNRDDLRFEPVGPKYQVSGIGWAYGAALVDLDNDGWLDLYATCGYVSKSRSEPDG